MICKKCGNEIKEENNFCTKCGAKIKKKNSLYTNFEKSVNPNKKFILLITFVIIMICSVVFILLTQYNIKKNDNIIEQSDSNLKEEIKELKINNLKYNIELKENGNMDVVETWDIEIPNTNTLYKTFVLDNNKYKGISNVRVSEILKNGEEKEFVKIEKEMYHVEKNCYYALINSSNQFEIAWGVDTINERKTYRISYTIENAIKIYNDCAELYWQFMGTAYAIPIDNIEGEISLEKQSDKDNIKMWIHTNDNNGKEIKSNQNNIIFKAKDFKVGDYLEIRITLPKESFNTNNNYNVDMLDTIIEEENKAM